MDEMVPANGHGISVAHDDNYLQARFGQFYTGSKGEGTPVGRVKRVEIHVHGQSSGATNARHEHYFVLLVAYAIYGPYQGAQHDPDPAAGAPYVREFLVMA
jgi:hypothetical protein